MSDPRGSQLERYVVKNTPSLDRIERLRALTMYLDHEDAEGHRDLAFVVSYFENIRHLSGKPTAPKLGGMDRSGIEAEKKSEKSPK